MNASSRETVTTRAPRAKSISPAALLALRGITWTAPGYAVLPPKLARPLYVECDAVLRSLGGRWSRTDKAHVFDEDQELALEALVNVGEFVRPEDYRKAFGFFETPPDLARRLVELARIRPGMSVLEPSAGTGRLLNAIRAGVQGRVELTAVEIQAAHLPYLAVATGMQFVVHGDFLSWARGQWVPKVRSPFDRVVMNPPFARQADLDHVLAAWHLLKPGGRLVAVMSASVTFRTNEKTEHFRALVDECGGQIIPNPPGSFASEGTNVNTVTVVMEQHR